MLAVALVSVFRLFGYLMDPQLTDAEIHRTDGDARSIDAPRAPDHQIKVVTWNIERGVNFDRIVDALRACDADVILLQEVDRFCRRSGHRDVARDLAAALNMNWVAGGEFQEVGEARGGVPAVTGQAILSRRPIAEAQIVVFASQTPLRWRFSPTQPRRGGRIALKARTAGLLVYDVHAESGGDDALRLSQLGEVFADADHQRDSAVVIAGDFNNSANGARSLLAAFGAEEFVDALGDVGDRRTSAHHRHPIDWIFTKGLSAAQGSVEQTGDTSDHYPLHATLHIPD
jgi:endonuclease/exonuclease/phosphatase family metal-dependent hydrolase